MDLGMTAELETGLLEWLPDPQHGSNSAQLGLGLTPPQKPGGWSSRRGQRGTGQEVDACGNRWSKSKSL